MRSVAQIQRSRLLTSDKGLTKTTKIQSVEWLLGWGLNAGPTSYEA